MPLARRPGDIVAGLLLWGLAALIWQQSTTWPEAGFAGNPVVMPRALALIMAACGAALILRPRVAPEAPEGGGVPRPRDALLAAVVTVGLALLLETLGLILAGVLYIVVLQRIVGAPWKVALPFAVAVPVAIWLIFVTALHVPLPVGEIFESFGAG